MRLIPVQRFSRYFFPSIEPMHVSFVHSNFVQTSAVSVHPKINATNSQTDLRQTNNVKRYFSEREENIPSSNYNVNLFLLRIEATLSISKINRPRPSFLSTWPSFMMNNSPWKKK